MTYLWCLFQNGSRLGDGFFLLYCQVETPPNHPSHLTEMNNASAPLISSLFFWFILSSQFWLPWKIVARLTPRKTASCAKVIWWNLLLYSSSSKEKNKWSCPPLSKSGIFSEMKTFIKSQASKIVKLIWVQIVWLKVG